MRIFTEKEINNKKELALFGLPIAQWIKSSWNEKYTRIFSLLPIKSYREKCFDAIISRIEQEKEEKKLQRKEFQEYDDIYVFLSHSGEFYILMHHIKDLLKKNNSKNPLFIFAQKYHRDIFKLFDIDVCAQYDYVEDIKDLACFVDKVHYKYKNRNFYIPANMQTWADIQDNINQNGADFYSQLLNSLGLENSESTSIKIPDKAEKKAQHLVENLGLNNFVLLSPECSSYYKRSKTFWDELSKSLISLGYQVYCNNIEAENSIEGAISLTLTIDEAIAFAKSAKAVIGLKSGFMDCLSSLNVAKHVLYSDLFNRITNHEIKIQNNLDVVKVMKAFSVKNLPNVNQESVYEYNSKEFSGDELLEKLLSYFK